MNYKDMLMLFSELLSREYTTVENGGSFSYSIYNSHLYIFFEGSNGETDWKNNLNFPAIPYHSMPETWFCHRGFLKVWKSIEPYLSEVIKDEKIKQITIAGYSHGGALAALCHEYAWFNRPDVRDKLYGCSFGEPRILWGIACSNVRKRWENYYPVGNIGDIVTKLPPAVLGFSHVKPLIKIGSPGKYTSIEAHFPQSYINELKLLAK